MIDRLGGPLQPLLCAGLDQAHGVGGGRLGGSAQRLTFVVRALREARVDRGQVGLHRRARRFQLPRFGLHRARGFSGHGLHGRGQAVAVGRRLLGRRAGGLELRSGLALQVFGGLGQLTFVDADASTSDPVLVGATARATVAGLRGAGERVDPAYTGAKGAAEVFAWVLDAAKVAGDLSPLAVLAHLVAQLLNELKQLRGADKASAPTPPIIVIVKIEGAQARLDVATAPTDAALLEQLLAAQLPAQTMPGGVTLEVRVPPAPLNEL